MEEDVLANDLEFGELFVDNVHANGQNLENLGVNFGVQVDENVAAVGLGEPLDALVGPGDVQGQNSGQNALGDGDQNDQNADHFDYIHDVEAVPVYPQSRYGRNQRPNVRHSDYLRW
ncbi:hypothetical protein OROGR_024831 [Orobanche gracilis]